MKKKTAAIVQTALFLAFLGVLFVLGLVLPKKSFSERENRALQTAPKFTFSALFSGKFTTAYEDFITDQFPLRDGWTTLKAGAELAAGKDANNGIYLCEGETLLEPYTAPAQDDLDFNLDAVNALAENVDVPVYFALIPSAAEIDRDLLPDGAPNDSQLETIDYAYGYVAAQTVDVASALAAHRDEPIFFRTDHHWTALGAYYGYAALAGAMGFDAVPLGDYSETVVSEEFYGTTYSSSGFSWVKPDSISTFVPDTGVTVTNYPQGAAVPGKLYDESFLAVKDKYSYFYGGNTPLLTVTTEHTDAPRLLILRDSYMDTLSPYLTAHFSELHILDLRYYRSSIKAYAAEHGIDAVLVCYSVKNFAEDNNLFLAGY